MDRYAISFHGALPSLALVLVTLLACTTAERESGYVQGTVVHPMPEAIPGFDHAHDFMASNGDRAEGRQLQALARTLQSASEALTVGVLEGNEHEVIGQIADIEVDSDGNMYVLDSEFSEVRVYSPEGAFLYAIGGPGEGPGEFSSPRHLDVDPSGRVVVADGTPEVTIFERTGKAHQLTETVQLPIEPNGMCLENGILLVQGFATAEAGIIFRFSLSGEELSSFGTGYKSTSASVRTYLNAGDIVCTQQPASVLYFPQFLPAIFAYSYEGDLQWVARLTEYESLGFVQEGSAVSFNVFTSHDQIIGAVPLPEGHVIVQTASFTAESLRSVDGERFTELRTYLMLAQTGRAVYLGSTLPRIYAVTAERMYTARTYPFPQLIVYRFPRRITGPAS